MEMKEGHRSESSCTLSLHFLFAVEIFVKLSDCFYFTNIPYNTYRIISTLKHLFWKHWDILFLE